VILDSEKSPAILDSQTSLIPSPTISKVSSLLIATMFLWIFIYNDTIVVHLMKNQEKVNQFFVIHSFISFSWLKSKLLFAFTSFDKGL
jgi:hypothetical protein